MGLGERLNRRLDNQPRIDPWFAGASPGYSQPSEVDPTGYTVEDPFADPGYVPPYGDPTDHVVPGGALGEAGAGWERADESNLMPQGEYVGPAHAEGRVVYGGEGTSEPHAGVGLDTGLGRMERDPSLRVGSLAGPSEYQGQDEPRKVLSDSDVYDDLYGSGREFGSRRGLEDDGIASRGPFSRGGDDEGRRQVGRRRLSGRSDDSGYS